MNKVALFTVFYTDAETYVNEFIESVRNQSYKEFDLIIVNDGYKDKDLSLIYQDLKIIELEGDSTISGNRAIGINYIIVNNYDYIFLCDVDDYMHPYRVEHVLNVFEGNDIIVNDLDIIDVERHIIFKDYFQRSINENFLLDYEFIKDKNIFGFSNTAMRVSSLSLINFPKDLKIVDWYYFTILLNNNLKTKFIAESLTEYRQYSGNMIGISTFTLDVFKRLIFLKMKHYSYFKNKIEGYNDLYEQMLNLSMTREDELNDIMEKNTENNVYVCITIMLLYSRN